LLIVGGAITVTVSEAVPPVPPSVELTAPVVFTCAPAAIPFTLTENVHDDPAPGEAVSVPPDKETVEGVPGGLLIVAVIVPLPQLPVTVVDASFSPAGRLSVNATPLNALAVFGFVTVKLSVVLLLSGMVFGLNDLLMVGGATTVTVAEAVNPIPPSVDVTALVVLACDPAVMPVTLTENVQDDPAPGEAVNVPSDKLTVEGLPGGLLIVAVIVPLPQLPVIVVDASFSPAGRLSVNATPLSALAVLGFVTVKLNVVLLLSGMLVGLNALLIVGGPTTTSDVLDVFPVPATVSLIVTLLGAVPATVPLTLSEIVHDAPAARLAPVKLMLPDPGVAGGVVLQVLVKPFGVATTSVPGAALGRVSVNEIPLSTDTALLFGFVIVKVRLVVPLSGILLVPNTLPMVGGLITVRLGLAVAVLPLPASVESIVTLLGFIPSEVPVTFTFIVHGLALTGRAAFRKLMLVAPGLAVILPPQPLTTPGDDATTRPGTVPPEVRSSVKLALMVTTFGLVIENVIVLVPPVLMTVGLKLFAIDGG